MRTYFELSAQLSGRKQKAITRYYSRIEKCRAVKMDDINNQNLLDRANKCALELGTVIGKNVPEDCRVALFTALLDHFDNSEHPSRDRLIRVFEAGILEGIHSPKARKFNQL